MEPIYIEQIQIGLYLFALLISTLLFSQVVRGQKMEPNQPPYLVIMVVANSVILLSNLLNNLFRIFGFSDTVLLIVNGFYLISFYIMLIFSSFYLYSYISRKRKVSKLILYISVPICAISSLSWIVSQFNGFIFTIDQGQFSRGPFYMLGQIGGFIVYMTGIVYLIRYGKYLKSYEIISFCSFSAFPVIAFFIQYLAPRLLVMPIAFTPSLFLMHELLQYNNIIREKEELTKLQENRMNVLLSQIKPHFVYNVLNTIYYLCDEDPAAAKTAIANFSKYLRVSFRNTEMNQMIPVSQEMAHVRHYLELEKIRFGDRLRIQYEIENDDFQIPPLLFEPLVENAVKHGITKNPMGGSLRIVVTETEDERILSVQDTGVGFAPNLYEDDPEHIGIRNTRERVKILCNGSLEIKSVMGEGTTATLSIPKQSGVHR